MSTLRYEEMNVGEIEKVIKESGLVYLPIGSLEYHGYHMPVGTDGFNAEALCLKAAAVTGGVVLPTTYWGTQGHVGYLGSLLISEEALTLLIKDVLSLLSAQKYRLIVIITGHYPLVQGKLLQRLADEHMKQKVSSRVLVLDPFSMDPTDPLGDHAGREETSMLMAIRPDLIHMEVFGRHPDAMKAIIQNAPEASYEHGRERHQHGAAWIADRVKREQATLNYRTEGSGAAR